MSHRHWYDSEYFQIIHVDPWKKYQKYEEGLLKTVELIEHLHKFNPKVEFEVGTEESIRRFEVDEFNKLLCDLKSNLKESSFKVYFSFNLIPAGHPSTTTPRAFPWDSPQEVILKN